MRNLAISSAIAATAIAVMSATPASAQATRTWVSGVGDDVNPCSRTAPCKTFGGAISKTAIGGEIDCLDPAGYGAVTITKSLTIDCHYTYGSILASGVNGIIINVPVNGNDPLRTVRLRGLTINGAGNSGTVGTRTGIRGISAIQFLNLFIDDVLVTQFTLQGLSVTTSVANGKTYVSNSVFRDNGGAGIAAAGTTPHNMILNNVQSTGNQFGLATATGNLVLVNGSNMSGNSNSGVEADGGSQVTVDGSAISSNVTGVLSNGGTIRLSNNNISFNGTAVTGATTSFGNNRLTGNAAPGTVPTPVGAISQENGQN